MFEAQPELIPPRRDLDAAILDPEAATEASPPETVETPEITEGNDGPIGPELPAADAGQEVEQDSEVPEIPVIADAPPIVPPARPEVEEAQVEEPQEDLVAALIEEALQDPATAQPSITDDIRPKTRPEDLVPSAEDVAERPADAPVRSRYALNNSERPQTRPSGFAARVISVATAPATEKVTATPAPAPAPSVQLPTSASVQQAATSSGAINLRNVNLIGVSGSDGRRTALIRMPNGSIVSVNTGDKFSGYQVAAIGRNAVRIRKNGKDTVLEIPE